MKFQITIEVPEELMFNYKSATTEENLNLDFDSQKVIEDIIKDMIEDMTSWEVIKCLLVER